MPIELISIKLDNIREVNNRIEKKCEVPLYRIDQEMVLITCQCGFVYLMKLITDSELMEHIIQS